MMIKRKFNYRFSQPDPRDLTYHHMMKSARPIPLPDAVDLTRANFYPAIQDQGEQGSCTAEAACAVKSYITRRFVPDQPFPSVDGFYYCEREANGTTHIDAGSDGRTSALVMLNVGVGSEKIWSYTASHLLAKPHKEYYADAAKNKIGAFYFLHGHEQMKHCLALGYPFVFGTTCTKQMCADDFDGWIREYKVEDLLIEDGELAGHQMCCFGYKHFDGKLFYLIRQSWGVPYGLKNKPGHFWLTGDMMLDRAWVDDCLTYRLAREPGI